MPLLIAPPGTDVRLRAPVEVGWRFGPWPRQWPASTREDLACLDYRARHQTGDACPDHIFECLATRQVVDHGQSFGRGILASTCSARYRTATSVRAATIRMLLSQLKPIPARDRA